MYGVYAPLMSEMGLSAKKHPDALTFDLLGKGFQEKSYDGVAYFSDIAIQWEWIEKSPVNKGTEKLSAASYAQKHVRQ